MDIILTAFIFAFFIDLVFGEPGTVFHPVVWLGKVIDKLAGFGLSINKKNAKKAYGFFILVFLSIISILLGYLIQTILVDYLDPLIAILILAYLIKSCFSFNLLVTSAYSVYTALRENNIEKSRVLVGNIVSRDVSNLNKEEIISASIESTAENFVDSFLSPIFYFLLFGLPGIFCFRVVNTLDAMIGYKNEKWSDIGFASAKSDDILNFIPSRISVALLLISYIPWYVKDRRYRDKQQNRHMLKNILKERKNVESPNSGYPMASISEILRVRLTKRSYYLLGSDYNYPLTEDIIKTIIIVSISSLITAVISVLTLYYASLPFFI
ncbi:MAG TPA: cobalamin biosynthesis protein [Halobacteria archaeon]|jgi:adenosylcobinamide-phosphate synthase|nr:cobalamin biosynthesis protein [Halobacteria archaeon]